jgi:hypothetical protein
MLNKRPLLLNTITVARVIVSSKAKNPLTPNNLYSLTHDAFRYNVQNLPDLIRDRLSMRVDYVSELRTSTGIFFIPQVIHE